MVLNSRPVQRFYHTLPNSLGKCCPASYVEWRCRFGGQSRTWTSDLGNDVERLRQRPIYGHHYRKQSWEALSMDLAPSRR